MKNLDRIARIKLLYIISLLSLYTVIFSTLFYYGFQTSKSNLVEASKNHVGYINSIMTLHDEVHDAIIGTELPGRDSVLCKSISYIKQVGASSNLPDKKKLTCVLHVAGASIQRAINDKHTFSFVDITRDIEPDLSQSIHQSLRTNIGTTFVGKGLGGEMVIASVEPVGKNNLVVISSIKVFDIMNSNFKMLLGLLIISLLSGFFGLKVIRRLYKKITENLDELNSELLSKNKELNDSKTLIELNEKKMRMIIDNTTDLEIFRNSNGRIEYVSPSVQTLLGYEPESLINSDITIEDLVAEECKTNIEEVIYRVSKGETVVNHECKLIHKNGQEKCVSISSVPVFDASLVLVGIRCSIRDITEKKKAIEQLVLSKNLYRQLSFEQELVLDNLPALAYYKDTKNCYVQVNKYVADAMGMAKEELAGKDLADIYPKKLADKYYADDLEVIRSKTAKFAIEEPWVTNNDLRWISTSKIPLLDENNQVKGIIGLSLDITAQKEKELLLKTRDQHMKLITSNIPAIIYHVDYNLTFIFANLEFENFTNKLNNDILGKKMVDVLDDYAYTSMYPFIQRVLSGDVISFENEMINAKGQKRVFKTTFVPEAGKNNEVDGFFAMAIDLTAEIDYKRQLIVAKDKAEESDRLKTAFLSNISHEIRTPMNGIMGFAQLLVKSTTSDEKRNMYIATIEESCQKLLSVINDIIDVSKIETGQIDVINEPANINHLLNEIFTKNQQFRNTSGIDFAVSCDLPENKSKIEIDKVKFLKVLECLISNAKKFTKQGRIELGYKLKGYFMEFFVKDSGIGIPAYMHDKIFNSFLQVERGMNRNYGGTGLGLSITRGYVNLMGGKIWLKSEVGVGTEFYFTVPYKKITDEQKEVVIDTELDHDKFVKILVAEDEEINYEYIKAVFEDTNYHLVHVYNGLDAVEYCNANDDVSLILMDIKMPIMDGYKATKIIRESNPTIPIIAQTAFALSDDAGRIKSYGFDDYISKPMPEDVLLEMVKKHLFSKWN